MEHNVDNEKYSILPSGNKENCASGVDETTSGEELSDLGKSLVHLLHFLVYVIIPLCSQHVRCVQGDGTAAAPQ